MEAGLPRASPTWKINVIGGSKNHKLPWFWLAKNIVPRDTESPREDMQTTARAVYITKENLIHCNKNTTTSWTIVKRWLRTTSRLEGNLEAASRLEGNLEA